MEENPIFTTVTTILGIVIGAILLGIVGVTLYVAVSSERDEPEVASVATPTSVVNETSAREGDAAEAESAADAESTTASTGAESATATGVVTGTESSAADTLAPAEAAAQVVLDAAMPAESVLEPFVPLPSDPADAAVVALGKYLFFDQRLSGNVSLSCATCHQPENAWADGQALSRGYPSTAYFRNTPTLMNAVYADQLYRDGRVDGNDLPALVRDHIAEAHFMSMDDRLMVERINQIPAYVDLFDQAFGSEPSFDSTLNAVAAYVRTLNSPPTAYDLYVAGDETALSDEAKAGLELFEGKANCATCHSGDLFTDEQFHNTGVGTDLALFEDPERHLTFRRFFRTLGMPDYHELSEDVGLYALTSEENDRGAFNTPGLREVGRTSPYMHDGSIATLAEVVAFYNEGGGDGQTAGLTPLDLSETESAQLVAFLESLSSEPVTVEVPELPDYDLVALGDSSAASVATATSAVQQAEAQDLAAADPNAGQPPTEEDAAQQDALEAAERAAAVAEEPGQGESAQESADDALAAAAQAAGEPAGDEPVAEDAGPSAAAVPVTDELVTAFNKGTCNACHTITDIPGAVGMVGPDLSNIGIDGATRIEGMSAYDYIHESIVDPMAFKAPKCPFGDCVLGTMPPNILDMISQDELDMIVNYLASLGSGG